MNFKERIERASVALVRAAIAGAVATLTGVGAVVDQTGNKALGTALLIGAGAGVLRLVQTWIPGLTFGSILTRAGAGGLTAMVDSFARAFISATVVYAYGIVTSPDTDWTQALSSAAIIAAMASALRAGEAAATKSSTSTT